MKKIYTLITIVFLSVFATQGIRAQTAIGNDAPVFTQDFLDRVALGLIPGYTFVEKFGENPDIDAGFETLTDIGGVYVPPTQSRIHNVASDSALDDGTLVSGGTADSGSLTSLVDAVATFQSDGVAVGDQVLNDSRCEIGVVSAIPSETELTIIGRMRSPDDGMDGTAIADGDAYRVVTNASTGASIIYLKGEDSNLTIQNEFVILNGVSDVATVNSYLRQFRARAFGPDTSGAVGTLTSTAQTDGTISCQIIDGNNQTLMSVYTIPSDKDGWIVSWWASLSKKQAAFSVVRLRAGILDGIGYIQQTRALGSSGDSDFKYTFDFPLPITGGADMWMEADSSAPDLGVSGGFAILLKDRVLATIPTVVSCAAAAWCSVATNVQSGTVHIQGLNQNFDTAYYTVVNTGDSAPTLEPGEAGNKSVVVTDQSTRINSLNSVDVYLFPSSEIEVVVNL